MQSRSVSRELALLLLSQISENDVQKFKSYSIEKVLNQALDTLMQHWKGELDQCENYFQLAREELYESEFNEEDKASNQKARENLKNCLIKGEYILNSLSDTIELSRLLSLSDQEEIRKGAINRVSLVVDKLNNIDNQLNNVMEGWRLKRLPRIDRDILRLTFVDLHNLNIPIAVACNEAVNLANRYSDDQGRRMINGILRRLQEDSSVSIK